MAVFAEACWIGIFCHLDNKNPDETFKSVAPTRSDQPLASSFVIPYDPWGRFGAFHKLLWLRNLATQFIAFGFLPRERPGFVGESMVIPAWQKLGWESEDRDLEEILRGEGHRLQTNGPTQLCAMLARSIQGSHLPLSLQ